MERPNPLDLKYRHVVFEGKKTAGRRSLAIGGTVRGRGGAHTRVEPEPSEAERGFLLWLFERAGLDGKRYRWGPLLRRLGACMRALQVESMSEARAAIEGRPRLLAEAVEALVIGTTGFFRDADVYECLRERVLPELAGRGVGIDIWCAGCSDGAELYSVGMLLGEMGEFRGRWLGTDCRARAIGRARRGVFNEAAAADIGRELGERWLEVQGHGQGHGWRVGSGLRERVEWGVADVFGCGDVGCWDLVFCRNLAIYLQGEAAEDLWELLAKAMRAGGVLVVGKAERPGKWLGLTRIGAGIYRRQGIFDE